MQETGVSLNVSKKVQCQQLSKPRKPSTVFTANIMERPGGAARGAVKAAEDMKWEVLKSGYRAKIRRIRRGGSGELR